jgi:hypothetical protein
MRIFAMLLGPLSIYARFEIITRSQALSRPGQVAAVRGATIAESFLIVGFVAGSRMYSSAGSHMGDRK